ncbi:serine/threonine-protein kinase [Lentisphaerota bacterium ZTH]|nr:serine/threonine protein kinase [Lentisphaerota bacterium]WET05570.1 serine/threonine-protein kinase [Lentisphaerota bacterium ZTH]
MRFQCSFCLSIVSTDQPLGNKIPCPSCGRSCFVPRSHSEEHCVIGDFVVGKKVGSGSIGSVFKAKQLSLERDVALKLLLPELSSPKFVSAFLKEARAAAQLSHANLVQAYAVGEENGICYLAMNYIDGESLSHRLEREGSIAVDEALHIIQQVAEALYYAWDEARLIHRDVKPDNIMITKEGMVKLTDLGLAMNQAEWTEDMEISGSPSYMSPEQFAGEKLDTRSDIYSLGVTLYQMLSGELPFKGETFQDVARQHFNEDSVPLHRLGLGISLKVSNLVKKMMEKLPEDRHENMEGLLKELWTVRQTTAPDRDLVPDVHTISINKLDYDLQNRSIRNKVSPQERIKKLKGRRDFLFWLLVTVFPLPIVVLAVFLFFRETRKEPPLTLLLEEKMQDFAARFEKKQIHPTLMSVEAEQLMHTVPPRGRQTVRQSVIYWQLKCFLEKIENEKLKIDMDDSRMLIKSLEDKYRRELSGKNLVSKKMQASSGALKKQLADHRSKAEKMIEVNKKLSQQIEHDKKNITALQTDIFHFKRNYMLVQLYVLIQKPDFEMAYAMLEHCREILGKKFAGEYSSMKALIARLELLTQYFSKGNARMLGKPLEPGCKITMIRNGIVYYEDDSGDIRSKPVFEIPDKALFKLVRSTDKRVAGSFKVFSSDMALLNNCPEAPEAVIGGSCAKELVTAYVNFQVERIIALGKRNHAAAKKLAEKMVYRFRLSPLCKDIELKLKAFL